VKRSYVNAATGQRVEWPDLESVSAPPPDRPDDRTNDCEPTSLGGKSVRGGNRTAPGHVHSVTSVSIALKRLRRVVGENFPEVLNETIACLSVAATLLLEDQQNPVALNLEGVPSSQKTTLVDFLGGADDKVYRSDKFTPKSFVSHAASISREKLNEIDLLPRVKHKLFLVPELAPLFGLRNEDLLESFAILTRVLDGQGLSTDSGVHGRRGHEGDYLFAWIGCTTPIPHNVWKTMGKLGSRFLFLEMPDGEHSNDELVDSVAGGQSYMARVKVCREEVASFLGTLWMDTGGVRGVRWDRGADPRSVMLQIAAYAKVLARLRGTISVWREGSGDDETYNFSTPMIEQPYRAMSLLYALARGHALVHGRRQLSEEDLPLVARAALESTPNDRRAVMRLLLAKEGVVSTADVQEALRCSAPTGRAILETLEKLGIGEFVNPGPPAAGTLTLDEPLRWLLEPIESKLTPCASRIEKKPTPCASEGLAEVLCLICELRPVVGGPCSLRCAECRKKAAA
jgi:hypothetical protein